MKDARNPLGAVALGLLLAYPALAYNSEEHKILADRGASMVRIDPSITLPAPTQVVVAPINDWRQRYRAAKYFAVGFWTNNPADYDDEIKKVQDNSYWSGVGWDQVTFNKVMRVPTATEVSETTLVVTGFTGGSASTFTLGELVALYGDYRRTTFCVGGNCHLTNASTTTVSFLEGRDCFGVIPDCGYRPDPMPASTYLRHIGNGLVPPYDPPSSPNSAPDQYGEAAWWGDEMLRVAMTNDWHFSSAAVAWYVGMHRLALLNVERARVDPVYWNHALHYEANALHSLTDLFAFGHVVANRDRTSFEILDKDGLTDTVPYQWMQHAMSMGGGGRDAAGKVTLGASLPPLVDAPAQQRNEYLPSTPGTWLLYGVQEKDFHSAYNGSGATVRNLNGDRFVIYGDGDYLRLPPTSRALISDAVRASLQSLFDAYVELEQGGTVAEIGGAGSPFFAALRRLPVFVESNPIHTYQDFYGATHTTGNNYNGRWTRYAEAMDVLAGTDVVPATAANCLMRYEDGEREIEGVVANTPCTTFPEIVPTPPPGSSALFLAQNQPNPFTPTTTIAFGLAQESSARLEIFDLRGARVVTLVDGPRSAGPQQVRWDGTNSSGVSMQSGVYVCRLVVGDQVLTRKLALVR